jgi:hypothetical protein
MCVECDIASIDCKYRNEECRWNETVSAKCKRKGDDSESDMKHNSLTLRFSSLYAEFFTSSPWNRTERKGTEPYRKPRATYMCGNKMPTRCNRWFLQILLLAQHVSGTTMPIIRSSRLFTGGCCLWYLVLWFSSCRYGVELRVMCPVCGLLQQHRTHNTQLHTVPTTWKPRHQIPQAATTCIILWSSWWWA